MSFNMRRLASTKSIPGWGGAVWALVVGVAQAMRLIDQFEIWTLIATYGWVLLLIASGSWLWYVATRDVQQPSQNSNIRMISQKVYAIWTSYTDHADDPEPLLELHLEIINASEWPLDFRDAIGQVRMNGKIISTDIEIAKPLRVNSGSTALLTVTVKLNTKASEYVLPIARKDRVFDLSGLELLVHRKLLAIWGKGEGLPLWRDATPLEA